MSDNKARYTPGPWECVGDRIYAESWKGPGNSNGLVATGCQTDERSPSIIMANARLISAAPDLYEALEALYETLEALKNAPIGESGQNIILNKVWKQIDAALAKARGEEA